MAATYSATASGTGVNQTSITTGTLTVGASDNYAVVCVEDDDATTIGTVTACGQSCSALGASVTTGSRRVRLYGAASPTVGAGQSATVTWTNGDSTEQHVVLIVAAGVDSVANYTTASGFGTAVSLTVPSVTSHDLVVDMAAIGNLDAVGADQTSRYLTTVTGVSTQPGTAGGVMTWTGNEELAWVQAGIRCVGSAGGGGGSVSSGVLIAPAGFA